MNVDWYRNLLKETIEKEVCKQIFNTDQGSHYKSDVHIKVPLDHQIKFKWITKLGQFSIFLLNDYDGHLNMKMYICNATRLEMRFLE
jgi:hypothetical protein